MNLSLLKLYDALRSSFWFLPAVMAVFAGAAAFGVVAVDHHAGDGWLPDIGLVWSGGAEGARSVLTVIAGSVMTVVSIVFSVTVTALAQTSSHYGPRVLRNFTSDRGNQLVLGTFVGTFVYCLLVLRTVRSEDALVFVPYIAVNLGILLALASLGVLIYFIHHISQSIQAEVLIADIGVSFQRLIPVLFPARLGDPVCEEGAAQPDEAAWNRAACVDSRATGYMQRIDDDRLIDVSTRYDVVIRLECLPGEFVADGSVLARVLPAAHACDNTCDNTCDELLDGLRACFSIGRHRTPDQDALYPIQLLVEIAAHALSPGINEPFTAMTCIDWIGAGLRQAALRGRPPSLRRGADGRLRVVACPVTFGRMLETAFGQIRLYGASNPEVVLRALDVIADLAPLPCRDDDRRALREQARLFGDDAAREATPTDRDRLARRVVQVMQALRDPESARIET
ncbi:MAG: DUF2254 domain-containing protein [Burkholderiaceae bacterium]